MLISVLWGHLWAAPEILERTALSLDVPSSSPHPVRGPVTVAACVRCHPCSLDGILETEKSREPVLVLSPGLV